MDFSKHIQKAEEAHRRRNYDFAIELYRQLLDLNPDLGEARSGLRRALQKRHEGKRGGKFLRAVGGAVPLAKARTLLKMGKHAAAANALEDYLSSNPLDEEANLMLGAALENAGHLLSACAVFEFLAEIAPKNPEGLKRAGAMMQRTGDPKRALEYFERALDADPRDRDALKARKDLAAETALSSSGLDSAAHSRDLIRDKGMARTLEREQRRHRSEEELVQEADALRARIAEEGSSRELWLDLASTLGRMGQMDEAEDWLVRLSEYRDLTPGLRNRAGELLTRVLKRSTAAASKAGNEALAGEIESRLHEFELTELRRRIELEPADSELRLGLGKRLLRLGELDQAAAELQRAIGDPRTKGEALFFLGQCFQKKGILDLARSQFSAALEGLPSSSDRAKEILYSLAAISEAEGDAILARSFFVRIYEVDIGYRDVAEKMEQLK
ncbi:MAG: tetratricopeptide (TPR) repeat protein [Planctomycetota bacterium]